MLWNKFGSWCDNKEKKCGPETPPVENHSLTCIWPPCVKADQSDPDKQGRNSFLPLRAEVSDTCRCCGKLLCLTKLCKWKAFLHWLTPGWLLCIRAKPPAHPAEWESNCPTGPDYIGDAMNHFTQIIITFRHHATRQGPLHRVILLMDSGLCTSNCSVLKCISSKGRGPWTCSLPQVVNQVKSMLIFV